MDVATKIRQKLFEITVSVFQIKDNLLVRYQHEITNTSLPAGNNGRRNRMKD